MCRKERENPLNSHAIWPANNNFNDKTAPRRKTSVLPTSCPATFAPPPADFTQRRHATAWIQQGNAVIHEMNTS